MATTIDEALDIIHRTGPDLVGGNSNHGPMVAEALLTLGRPGSVMPWLEGYKNRFQDRPQPDTPISPKNWHESLGDRRRSADWVAFFDGQQTGQTAPGPATHGGRRYRQPNQSRLNLHAGPAVDEVQHCQREPGCDRRGDHGSRQSPNRNRLPAWLSHRQ